MNARLGEVKGAEHAKAADPAGGFLPVLHYSAWQFSQPAGALTGRSSYQLRFRVRLPKKSEPQNETRTSAQLARPNNARIVSSIIESTPFYRGFAIPTRRS